MMKTVYCVCGLGYDKDDYITDYEMYLGDFNKYEEAYEFFIKLQCRNPKWFFRNASDVYQLLLQLEECEDDGDEINCIDVKNEWWIENPNFKEDLNMNNRINAIAEFAQKRDKEKMAKEMELLQRAEECKTKIRVLEPRISELLEVGNACVKNNIPLKGSAWGGHEGYDTHQFITNRWSHLVGFVDRKNGFAYLGIDAGGACGKYDFRTNGIDIYDVHEETKEKTDPSLYHMLKFLEKFDEFESEFYAYVDKVCKSK